MKFSTGIIALAATCFTAVSGNPVAESNAEPIESAALVERQGVHPSYATDAEFQRVMLAGHNYFRYQHQINTPLTWNTKRAADSAAYAAKCVFQHSGAVGAGENLAMGYPDAGAVTSAWALERTKYNYANPGFSSATGHFTQVVWKKTLTMGCGRANCGSRGWLVVCQYVAPGNVLPSSNFRTNVLTQNHGKITDKYVYTAATKKRSVGEEEVPLVAPIKIFGQDEE